MEDHTVPNHSETLEPITITLDELREKYLTKGNLLEMAVSHQLSLVDPPVGSGKSTVIDQVIVEPELYDHFGRVIYTASRWDIIKERPIVKGTAAAPVGAVVIYARPKDRCNKLNDQWLKFEKAGCHFLGKQELCTKCPANTVADPCHWVKSMADKVGDARLVFLPDQHFTSNPSILRFLKNVDNKKTLLIADEGIFLTRPNVIEISANDLNRYTSIVSSVPEVPIQLKENVAEFTKFLATATKKDLLSSKTKFPSGIDKYGVAIQSLGFQTFGSSYRDISYSLQALCFSHRRERWKANSGSIQFLFRPYLTDCHTLVCSGHLTPRILQLKTKMKQVHAPFSNLRVKLPGTKVYNIKTSTGRMANYLDVIRDDGSIQKGNIHSCLSFFRKMIMKNIAIGKSTVLVSKKGRPLEESIKWLQNDFLANDVPVTFLTEPFDQSILDPNPSRIPVITYGASGVNIFSRYDCCYCINSFYINKKILAGQYFDGIPEEEIPAFDIRKDENGYHKVFLASEFSGGVEDSMNELLQSLEKGTAIQAIGRVRPYNFPREIILFSTHNFYPEFGDDYTEFNSLAEAYQFFDLDNITTTKRRDFFDCYRELLAQGLTKKAAREQLDISKYQVCRFSKDFSTSNTDI